MVYKLSEIMPEVPPLTPKETSGPVGSILEGPTLFLARDYFRRLGVVLGEFCCSANSGLRTRP